MIYTCSGLFYSRIFDLLKSVKAKVLLIALTTAMFCCPNHDSESACTITGTWNKTGFSTHVFHLQLCFTVTYQNVSLKRPIKPLFTYLLPTVFLAFYFLPLHFTRVEFPQIIFLKLKKYESRKLTPHSLLPIFYCQMSQFEAYQHELWPMLQ